MKTKNELEVNFKTKQKQVSTYSLRIFEYKIFICIFGLKSVNLLQQCQSTVTVQWSEKEIDSISYYWTGNITSASIHQLKEVGNAQHLMSCLHSSCTLLNQRNSRQQEFISIGLNRSSAAFKLINTFVPEIDL